MISRFVSKIILALAILAFLASISHAQGNAEAIFNGDSHHSFVISGGISLGNYEAGVNWAIMRTLRSENIDRRQALRSVVGASAGGINTLANVAYWCMNDTALNNSRVEFPDSVDSNIFKNIWAGVGFDDLLPENESGYLDGDGLLSRKKLEQSSEMLKRYIMNSRFADCRVPMAITLTKVNKQSVEMNGLVASNNRYVVPLNFITNSSGAYFENLKGISNTAETLMGNRVYLPTIDGTNVHVTRVLEAVKATSAFPVAFGTMELEVCEERGECGRVEFLDGGVLDNVPLGTAVAISNIAGVAEDVNFIMIDPDNTRFRAKRGSPLIDGAAGEDDGKKNDKSFMDQLRFIKGFYSAARSYELYSSLRYINVVLEQEMNCEGVDRDKSQCGAYLRNMRADKEAKAPRNIEKVDFQTTTRFPLLTGNYMIAFGAFLDDAFRRYDYYAGVYDGVLNMALEKCVKYDCKCLSEASHGIYDSLGIANSPYASMVFSYLAHEEFSGNPDWQWAYDENPAATEGSMGEQCLKRLIERQKFCYLKEGDRNAFSRNIWPRGSASYIADCMAEETDDRCSVALYAVANSFYIDHNDTDDEPGFDKFMEHISNLYSMDKSTGNDKPMSYALKKVLVSEGWGNPLIERALTRLKTKDDNSHGKLGPVFGLGGSYVQSQIEKQRTFVPNRTSSKNWLLRLVPYELSVNLNTRAMQATWEPRLNLSSFNKPWYGFKSLALNTKIGGGTEENVILEREGEEHWYAVIQPFLTLEGDIFTVGVAPVSYTWMDDYKWSLGYAAYVGLLDDRLRLTYGEREYGRTKFKKDTYVTLGVADLAGLIGWIKK